MKLRIVTSMLLIMFLSVGSASVANAHEGCGGDHYCCSWGHGWGWGWGHHWGCNNYIYGPDGLYAQCRDGHHSCCGDKDAKAEHKCADRCEQHSCCEGPRYHRAYYYEDCCGWGGHLNMDCHSDCHHGCDKKDNDDKDKD
jgi:hypothetical protein